MLVATHRTALRTIIPTRAQWKAAVLQLGDWKVCADFIDGDIAKTTASQLPNGEQHQPLLSGSADTGPSAAKIENYSSRRVGPPSFANPPKAKAPPAVPAVLADVSSMAPPPAIPQVCQKWQRVEMI